jgi:GNAT superfamily N-acetyltransferase
MSTVGPDLDHCIDVLHGYFELGNVTSGLPGATLVRNDRIGRVFDANCVTRVRAESAEAVGSLMASVDAELSDLAHRTYKLDPLTPTAVEARLVLEGYEPDPELQMVLRGELARPEGAAGGPVDSIRPVVADRDWRSLSELVRLDHLEEAERGRRPIAPEVTAQIVEQKQAKAPAVQFFLAALDGEDVAFFSSWPGHGGLGKVEDLFTRPDHRNRGIATALIAHCVSDARERGADAVLIGAAAADTPRLLYARLGFEPVLVYTSYTLAPSPPPER